PDAVRPDDVAPHDRPADPDDERDPREVGHRGVRHVGMAVEELPRARELMVDLEDHRGHEQPDEAEVDERVHHARGRVAQQGAHPDARAEVLHPLLDVASPRPPVVGLAPLVVLHAQRDEPRDDEQHDRDREVEGDLDRPRDVAEHPAGDARVVLPVGQVRYQSGRERAESGEHADPQHDLMGLGPPHAPPPHTVPLREREKLPRGHLAIPVRRGSDARARCAYWTLLASYSRRRWARPARSLREKPGTSSMIPANSRWPSTTTSIGVSATTVALRGARSSRASSPKASPGPSVATLRPLRVTLAVPSTITKNSEPGAPSLTRTLPALTFTSSARRATRPSSLRDRAENRDT